MGKRAPFVIVAVVVLLLVGGAIAVYAYDNGRQDLIANGVRVAGIDVGGLRRDAATRLLQERLAARIERPITVHAENHRFRLTPQRAEVHTDVGGMVAQAVADSRGGSIIARTWRGVTGGHVDENIRLRLSYSKDAVARLVRHVRRVVHRPARDASVQASGAGLATVSSRTGIALQVHDLQARIEHAITTPGAAHVIVAHTRIVEPKVTTAQLAGSYPWYVVINRSAFRLTVYEHLKPLKTYTIAVGMQGLETPAGLYHVQDKQVDPSWHVPNSSWAGALAGKVIPPGPQDPIKARWLGIYNGAGIHGTEDIGSLGSAASHGCIRMSIPDVIEVYNDVPVGAPVFIA